MEQSIPMTNIEMEMQLSIEKNRPNVTSEMTTNSSWSLNEILIHF